MCEINGFINQGSHCLRFNREINITQDFYAQVIIDSILRM